MRLPAAFEECLVSLASLAPATPGMAEAGRSILEAALKGSGAEAGTLTWLPPWDASAPVRAQLSPSEPVLAEEPCLLRLPLASASQTLAVVEIHGSGPQLEPRQVERLRQLLAVAGALLQANADRQLFQRENESLRELSEAALIVDPGGGQRGVMQAALRQALRALGLQWGIALLAQEAALVLVAQEGLDGLAQEAMLACPLDPLRSPAVHRLASVGVLEMQHCSMHPGLEACFGAGVQRFSCLVLKDGERLGGLLLLASRDRAAAMDRELYHSLELFLADQAGRALQTVRLVEALQESNARLTQTHRRLIEAERLAAVGRLASAVAHQVRNPLSVISASAEIMMTEAPRGTRIQEQLELMYRKASETEHIIQELMQLGRPLELKLEQRTLAERLLNLKSFLGPKAQAQSVELVVEPGPEGLSAWMDVQQFERCLLDLALNALQVMPEGGRLVLGCGLGPKERSVAWVQDNGPGLAPALKERIFEPFFTLRKDGTGLGLYNVKRICHAMGATVEAESVPGDRGSRFEIHLWDGNGPPGVLESTLRPA